MNQITVNFVYDNRFIGEMIFQFSDQNEEYKKKYHAQNTVYELA